MRQLRELTMYHLNAFNARGEQLFHRVDEYGAPYVTYSHNFAGEGDYSVILWSMGATAGIKSGYRIDDDAYGRGENSYIRNRIAYFEILDGPYLLARAVRLSHGVEIRPVVAAEHYRDTPAQIEEKRSGDARYSIVAEHTGAPRVQWVARFCFSASKPDGGFIGGADEARDAYAMVREHYLRNHPRPADAQAGAYRAMMADPFGPTDPFNGAAMMAQGKSARMSEDGLTSAVRALDDAMARSGAAPADDTAQPSTAVNVAPSAETDGFTPNPYWGDVEVSAVKVTIVLHTGLAIYRASDGEQLDFVEADDNLGDGQSLYSAGYPVDAMANAWEISVTDDEWERLTDATRWPATSEKFSNGLAERLHDSDFPDDTMGDVEGFGHYSLFRAERAILSTDNFGFVTVSVFDSESRAQVEWETLATQYERHCMAALEEALPTSECDGVFLIFDTARHIGETPEREDIREHVIECETCKPYRYVLDEF